MKLNLKTLSQVTLRVREGREKKVMEKKGVGLMMSRGREKQAGSGGVAGVTGEEDEMKWAVPVERQ